jgi:membrane-associated phospholipid phosphatase
MAFKLPAIDDRRKWLWAALGYVAFCLLYIFTGAIHLRTPILLAPSPIDNLLAFRGWTIWIYHSQFFFLMVTIQAIKKPENLTRMFYSMIFASLLSFAIFLLYPTVIARAVQPGSDLTGKAFQFLYAVDSSSNCFPSLHVSLAALSAIAVFSERTRCGFFALGYALLIMLSTMTTKQHYFIDVLGGFILAILCRTLVVKFS